jgi:hypothetical protein
MRHSSKPTGRSGGKNEQKANAALRGIRDHLKNKSGFLGAELRGPSGARYLHLEFMSQRELTAARLDPKYSGIEVRAEVPKRFARLVA